MNRGRRQWLRWGAFAGLIVASAYGGFWLHGHQERADGPVAAEGPAAGQEPPLFDHSRIIGIERAAFSLPDLDGRVRAASEWDGKVVALNFWASWCPPCLEEIPDFVSLQAQHQAAGLQFVGLALEPPATARRFAVEREMNYPVLTGAAEVIKLARAYGNHIGALPFTVFIDRTGRVASAHPGPLSREEAEELIVSLL